MVPGDCNRKHFLIIQRTLSGIPMMQQVTQKSKFGCALREVPFFPLSIKVIIAYQVSVCSYTWK